MINSKEEQIKELVSKNIYKIKDYAVQVNNGTPFFKKEDFDIIEGTPIYFEPDEYGRTSGAMAIISRNTLSIRTEKHLKYPDPNGWTKTISESGIFQRCHCIAYRLSAKKNDKKNIFIGTVDTNKTIMGNIEQDIENEIRRNEDKYIRMLYRVTPQYKGKNQIPTGVLLELKSLDTDYQLCEFCYNVQSKVKINYTDGTLIEDNRILGKNKLVKSLTKAYNESRQKRTNNGNMNLVIDDQNKVYHTENCTILNDVEPKYIKDITTKEQIIKDKGYSKCKKCFK